MLTQAGAVVTGRVIADRADTSTPSSAGVLDGLANQLKPADMMFADDGHAPTTRPPPLLAATVMTTDQAQVGHAEPGRPRPCSPASRTGGFLTIDGDPDKRATLAVMFAPETPYEGDGRTRPRPAAFDLARRRPRRRRQGRGARRWPPTAAAAGGVITALREDAELAKRVSTVDTRRHARGPGRDRLRSAGADERARRAVRHRPGSQRRSSPCDADPDPVTHRVRELTWPVACSTPSPAPRSAPPPPAPPTPPSPGDRPAEDGQPLGPHQPPRRAHHAAGRPRVRGGRRRGRRAARPACRARVRLAALLAGAGSGALGAYDDLYGDDRRPRASRGT